MKLFALVISFLMYHCPVEYIPFPGYALTLIQTGGGYHEPLILLNYEI